MRHEVVVIGGGVVGLSAAHELAVRGMDVAVVDRGRIGEGCAIGSAGHIVPSHVIPLAAPGAVRHGFDSIIDREGAVSVRWMMGPTLWRWLITFARASHAGDLAPKARALAELGATSVALIDSWVADNAIECHRRSGGLLDVYGDAEAFASAVVAATGANAYGVPIEVLDADGARSVEPALRDSVVGAIRYPDDGNLDPGAFLAGLRAATEAAGAAMIDDAGVLGFVTGGRIVRTLSTAKGPITTDHVVVAAGAWSAGLGRLLGERVPVVPGRGHSLTAAMPEGGPRHAMLLGEKHVAVGPMGDRLRLSGRFELGQYGTEPDPRWIDGIERLARSRLMIDGPLSIHETWAGLRPVTPDGVPIIGPSLRWDNVTIATGHAMIGLSIGPGTGRLVAQMVTGEALDFDPSAFSMARFG